VVDSVGSTQAMPLPTPIYTYFWVAPHLLLIAVAVAMFFKSLQTEYPIFFSALIYEFLVFAILLITRLNAPSSYLKVDFFARAGSTAFHFGILQELFEVPLLHDAALRRASAQLLRWVTGSLIVVALFFIGLQYYNSGGHWLYPPYATLEALNIVQCFVLVLVFLWHGFLGVRMSDFSFGIAVGLALTAAVELFVEAWKDLVGPSPVCDYMQMGFYHCTVLIWLYCALAHRNELDKTGGGPGNDKLLGMASAATDMERMIRRWFL
jgi:hypothetical protein